LTVWLGLDIVQQSYRGDYNMKKQVFGVLTGRGDEKLIAVMGHDFPELSAVVLRPKEWSRICRIIGARFRMTEAEIVQWLSNDGSGTWAGDPWSTPQDPN
jgi:hypothetical protein